MLTMRSTNRRRYAAARWLFRNDPPVKAMLDTTVGVVNHDNPLVNRPIGPTATLAEIIAVRARVVVPAFVLPRLKAAPIRLNVPDMNAGQQGQLKRIIPPDCVYYGGGSMKSSAQLGQEHRSQQGISLQAHREGRS